MRCVVLEIQLFFLLHTRAQLQETEFLKYMNQGGVNWRSIPPQQIHANSKGGGGGGGGGLINEEGVMSSGCGTNYTT